MKVRKRLAAVALVFAVVVGLAPAVAGAVPTAEGGVGDGIKGIRVFAPHDTKRGSVVLRGHTFKQSTVEVAGGVVPVTTFAGRDGKFSAEVLLRPGQRNQLT